MRNTRCLFARMVAAFGIGVLLSMMFPIKWLLIATTSVLIVTAVGCLAKIRG